MRHTAPKTWTTLPQAKTQAKITQHDLEWREKIKSHPKLQWRDGVYLYSDVEWRVASAEQKNPRLIAEMWGVFTWESLKKQMFARSPLPFVHSQFPPLNQSIHDTCRTHGCQRMDTSSLRASFLVPSASTFTRSSSSPNPTSARRPLVAGPRVPGPPAAGSGPRAAPRLGHLDEFPFVPGADPASDAEKWSKLAKIVRLHLPPAGLCNSGTGFSDILRHSLPLFLRWLTHRPAQQKCICPRRVHPHRHDLLSLQSPVGLSNSPENSCLGGQAVHLIPLLCFLAWAHNSLAGLFLLLFPHCRRNLYSLSAYLNINWHSYRRPSKFKPLHFNINHVD